jgi:hypothetical protein
MPFASGTVYWLGGRRPQLTPELVVDAHNAEAVDAMHRSIATGRPLILSGGIGTGKTTLMAEIDFWLTLRSPSVRAPRVWLEAPTCWTDVEGYCDDVKRAFGYNDAFDDWGPMYSPQGIAGVVPRLFLDDLGVERATDQNLDAVSSLLRERYERQLPTWITTNLSVADMIARYGQRVISRLVETTTIVEIGGRDRRFARAAQLAAAR